MKSSAALPFELPSMPASRAGFPTMPPEASDASVADETGQPASFDDVLQANAASTPAARLRETEPQQSAERGRSAGLGRPALVAPASFQDRVPMPASLLRQAPAETALADQGEAVVPAREPGSGSVVETAVYEWVAAMGLPQPVIQLNSIPPKPESGASSDLAGAEPEAGSAFSGRHGVAGPASVLPRLVETETASTGAAALEPVITVQQTLPARSDLRIAPQSPGAEVPAEPGAEPRVVTRQITVGGRRLEASSLGDFGVIKPRLAPVLDDHENAGEAVAAERAGLMPGRAGLPAELFQPVVGREAILVFQTVLGAGENVSVAVKLDPLSHPPLAKPIGREVPASAPTRRAAVDETVAGDSEVPVELAKVVENRLKAEGITLRGPLRIELIKAPTATEPGEFKVEAEKHAVKISGWWDQAGRMVSASFKPTGGTEQAPLVSHPRSMASDLLPAVPARVGGEVAGLRVDHLATGEMDSRQETRGVDPARRPEAGLTNAPAAPQPTLAKGAGLDPLPAVADRWEAAASLAPAAPGRELPRPEGKPDRKIQPVGPAIARPPQLQSAASGDSSTSAEDADPSAKQRISTPPQLPVPQRSNLNPTGGISSARQAVVMRSTNDQEEFAGDAGKRVSAGSLRNGDALGQSRPQDLLTELAAMPFAERSSRMETSAVNPAGPVDRVVQSDRIDKMDSVERLRSVIHHEIAVLKSSGADALAVVIRPTSDSEVFIQLTREKGGIEAFIRVEKGDSAELRRQWSHLEGALAEQQIRLQPLQSGSSMNQDSNEQSRQNRFSQQQDADQPGAKFSFDGQSRGGFRQEDQRRPPSPFEAEPLSPRTPSPSAPRSAPRRGASTDRNFDNWA